MASASLAAEKVGFAPWPHKGQQTAGRLRQQGLNVCQLLFAANGMSTAIDIEEIPVYTGIMRDQNPQPDPDVYRHVVALCTNANLRKTSRAITQLYDEFLQPSGLLGTQFRLLGAVAANGPITLTPLAEELTLDPTTLARNLKPLERDGLVETSIGEDRRTRLVTITKKGQSALLKALPLWEEAQAWVISQLGEDRWRAMIAGWAELVSLVHQR